MKTLLPVSLLALLIMLSNGSAAVEPGELAVVVNKSMSLDTISPGELRPLILGEKSKWPNGEKAFAAPNPCGLSRADSPAKRRV